ncbi:MAG: ADOP family duplicated permease [Gemmatimonadaceae bacterium]
MARKRSRMFQIPWRSRDVIARDVDSELGFHLDMRTSELIAGGMRPDDARRRATEEFGDIEFTRAYCRRVDQLFERDTRMADHLATWRQDLRYAMRTLRRSPGFAAVSLLTLALAIGANTAIFSVANAVLLAPLPYGNADAVVGVFESWPGTPDGRTPLSPPDYVDYRAQQRAFTDIAAYVGSGNVTWTPRDGDPLAIGAVSVTPNLFSVLRVRAQLGRTFAPGDDAPGAKPTAILSHGFWQRALGSDSAAIGRALTLNGRSYEVIGVMPAAFTVGFDEQIWLPVDFSDDLKSPEVTRRQHWVHAFGRLKRNISVGAANADLATISRRLAIDHPAADSGRFAFVTPWHAYLTRDLRPALLLLQGAAALVLLIACANLANLGLSRGMGRRREMAVRAALGAGRGRLVRQLLTETAVLAIAGGVLGVALAIIATRALLALNPDALPAMFAASVNARVVLFSVGLSGLTGMLCGILPAIDAARGDLHDSLKDGSRGTGAGRAGERVRRGLVVAQVGLAVMLLVGAGLLIRSFGALAREHIGFEPDHVLTAQLRASGTTYDSSAAINHFYDGVLSNLASVPNVVAVGGTTILPTQGHVGSSLRIEGEPTDENNLPDIGYVGIRGDYFKAMGIPIVAGRTYDATDLPDGPKTVIINQAAARRFFPKGDAVGRRIRIGPQPKGAWITIIGVAGDIQDEGIGSATHPALYANHRQEAWDRSMAIVVRTSGDPSAATGAIRRAVRAADPRLAVRDIKTLNDVLASSLAPRRFSLGLVASFACVALLLATIGIYGVLSYAVASRTREFGVRLALGASANSVLLLVARDGFAWSGLGLVVGLGAAAASGRLLQKMLFGVTPLDVSTYVGVAAGLFCVVGIACLVPAVRATKVDPLTSMRAE